MLAKLEYNENYSRDYVKEVMKEVVPTYKEPKEVNLKISQKEGMDMSTKMNIPFSPPDVGEEEINEVVDALKSGWITTGPKTKQFEKDIAELCHTEKAVCLNSATAALEMTLRVLGIGEGDEVITSSYTYTASASPVHHIGAKIVLVDTQKDSFEMDYDQLEKAIPRKKQRPMC